MTVKKLFGIFISPRHMTDEEYVEWVRRNLRFDKRIKWFVFAAGLLMWGGGFWLWLKFTKHIQFMVNAAVADKNHAFDESRLGLIFGMAIGAFIGLAWFFGATVIASAFKSTMGRNAKLLVKYHDELKSSGKK